MIISPLYNIKKGKTSKFLCMHGNCDTVVEIEDTYKFVDRFYKFKEIFRELWLDTYKPFGFEVIDMRIGTVIARIETLKFRLNEYIKGNISKIEEFEEERLYYNLDDWQKYTCRDLNLRTATYLKYVNPSSISMGRGD